MALIKETLQRDIQDVTETAMFKAYKAASRVSASEDLNENIENISKAFADAFSKEFAPKIASAIDKYIRTMTITVSGVAGVYPVVGTGAVS